MKKNELKKCECGGNAEIVEEWLDSIWGVDKFIVYQVICKECKKHTIVSGSRNAVIDYWNNDNHVFGGKK